MGYISKLKTLWGLEDISGSVHGLITSPKKMVNIAKYLIERPFNPIKPRYYPLTLMMEVSTVCNLKCPTCERELFKHQDIMPKGQVSLHNIEKLRPILPYVYSIYFVGGLGEPFLNPAFWDIHRVAKEYKLKTGYFSNAFAWDDEIIQRTFKEDVNTILVSIDSHIPEKYERFKQGAKFDVVVSNIKRLNEYRKRFNKKGFKLGLNYVQRSDNYEDMPDYLDFARKLEADYIVFTALIVHEEKDVDKSPYLVDVVKRKKVYDEVIKKAKDYNIKIRLPEIEIKDIYNNTCNSAWSCMAVFENGDVCPCPYFRTDRYFYFHAENGRIVQCKYFMKNNVIGNLYHQDIHKIWNSEKAIQIRKAIKTCKGIPSPCNTCYYRYSLH
ncbi:MAG: radical SAM protein [Deltaproteobacteria bacterium]|nr:radical SAM protein [Deltaproteobacteria bacterium]